MCRNNCPGCQCIDKVTGKPFKDALAEYVDRVSRYRHVLPILPEPANLGILVSITATRTGPTEP